MSRRKTILLVENEAAIAAARKKALEKHGYMVITAASGEIAVEKVRSVAGIDLVLADVYPGNGMEGLEAVQVILSEKDVPVLFRCGFLRQDIGKKTKEASLCGFATKGSGEAGLDASVKMALQLNQFPRDPEEPDPASSNNPDHSRQRYRVLMDMASDAIIISDVKGNFLEANRRAAELLGYTKKELVGMTPLHIHPKEEYDRIVDHFAGIAAGQMNALYDTKIVTKKGDIIPVDITGSPVKYGGRTLVQGIFRDITEHKRMEDELKAHRDRLGKLVEERTAMMEREIVRRKEKEGQYLALVESVKEWVWETDANFEHTYVSPRVHDHLGYRPEELIGKSPVDFMPAEERKGALSALKRILSLEKPFGAFQTLGRHKKGHVIYIEASGIPFFDERGKLLGYRGSCHDTTEQKNMMDALKNREKELVAKSQMLEEVNTALKVLLKQREEDRKELEGKFVSNVKEMILPYIMKIQRSQSDPRSRAYLDIVTTNLNEIISPFLSTVRQLNFTPREIEVASLIKEGRTTKEIARILGVATSAVDSYRNNMRIKLGLNKKKVNLRSYLLSLK